MRLMQGLTSCVIISFRGLNLCAESVKRHHLIQSLCVFSVRKISSILGISVDHGKNVSGQQAVLQTDTGSVDEVELKACLL